MICTSSWGLFPQHPVALDQPLYQQPCCSFKWLIWDFSATAVQHHLLQLQWAEPQNLVLSLAPWLTEFVPDWKWQHPFSLLASPRTEQKWNIDPSVGFRCCQSHLSQGLSESLCSWLLLNTERRIYHKPVKGRHVSKRTLVLFTLHFSSFTTEGPADLQNSAALFRCHGNSELVGASWAREKSTHAVACFFYPVTASWTNEHEQSRPALHRCDWSPGMTEASAPLCI